MVHLKLSLAFVLAAAAIAPVVALPYPSQHQHPSQHHTNVTSVNEDTGSVRNPGHDNEVGAATGLTRRDDFEILYRRAEKDDKVITAKPAPASDQSVAGAQNPKSPRNPKDLDKVANNKPKKDEPKKDKKIK